MPYNADTAIKVATSAGAIFGQCIFGYLGDRLGRKRMYGVELMIIITTTLAQALCGESATLSVVGVLIFYRVVMGIGVGGDCKSISGHFLPSLPAFGIQIQRIQIIQSLDDTLSRILLGHD